MNLQIPRFGCAALLALTGVGSIFAQQPVPSPTADPLDAIRTALQAERDAKKEKDLPDVAPRRAAQGNDDFSAYLEFIRQGLTQEDDGSALTYLAQIRAAAASDDLRKACDNLTE